MNKGYALKAESKRYRMYEVVKQKDKGYWTIFNGITQYCDEDGNPIGYKTYQEANTVCEQLNDD